MYPTWPIYMQRKTKGQLSGVNHLNFLINWERLFAEHKSCSTKFIIFGVKYLEDFKQN